MRVLKLTFEVPLATGAAAQSVRDASAKAEEFVETLTKAGFRNVVMREDIVSRAGKEG